MLQSLRRHRRAIRPIDSLILSGLVFISIVGSSITLAADAKVSEPTFAVKAEYNVMVPMRDGVHLSTDIYRPAVEGKYPVILMRSPYTNGDDFIVTGRWWASRGYVFLYQNVRGRYDSEGSWYPHLNEAIDGYDAQQWAGQQAWSNGKIGTLGGSYGGSVQWLPAPLRSPYLRALQPNYSPLSHYQYSTYAGGALTLAFRMYWAALVNGRTSQVPGTYEPSPHDWEKLVWHLPLITMDQEFGIDSQYWRYIVQHPSYDSYWQPRDISTRLEDVEVPALSIGGWFDLFLPETLSAFTGMTKRGRTVEARKNQKLIIGPWYHQGHNQRKTGDLDFGPQSTLAYFPPPTANRIDCRYCFVISLRWMDYWLKGVNTGAVDDPPVQIFVMGENKWRSEQEWPLARTQYTKYYFHSQGRANSRDGNGVLSVSPPKQEPPDAFTYDPQRPVPTKGGNLASPTTPPGPLDQHEVEQRDDVLVFTTAPLESDVEVTGPITVTVYASSSAKDTDFTAKLVDVHPDGRAFNLTDGILRARYRDSLTDPTLIEPGKVYPYRIEVWPTSNVFLRGHRIRVDISSSNFPRFDRNPNTGHTFGMDAELVIAKQTIYHDSRYPSHVVLPVIPR